MKLSGWQRLWVLVSVLWFIPIAVITSWEIPTESNVVKSWVIATLLEIKKNDDSLKDCPIWKLQEAYKGIPPRKLMEKVQAKYETPKSKIWVDFSEINKTYEYKLHNLPWLQLRIADIGFGVWLGSIIAVYILGWAIGWVYRGFRGSKQTTK